MSQSTRRSLAVAAAAAIVLAAPAMSFAADGGKPRSTGHDQGSSHAGGPHQQKQHGSKEPKHFTVTGVFDAAGDGDTTFTMDVKGGSRDAHNKKGVVITVSATTKFSRNDSAATLSQLVAGDRVAVNGVRGTNGELDARHVNAASRPAPKSPSESPAASESPASGESPSAEPSDSPDATTSPSPEPSDSSTGDPTPTPTSTV